MGRSQPDFKCVLDADHEINWKISWNNLCFGFDKKQNNYINKNVIAAHEIFEVGFFHQTTPPGPIRGNLELFLILATFHGVIKVLKWLPGGRDTGDSRLPGVCDTRNPQLPGVPDTGVLF